MVFSYFVTLSPAEQAEGKPWYTAFVDWAFGSGWLTPVIVGLTVAAVLGLVRFLWSKTHPKDVVSSPHAKSTNHRRNLTYEGPKFSYGTAKESHVGPSSVPTPTLASPELETKPAHIAQTRTVEIPKNLDSGEGTKPSYVSGVGGYLADQLRAPISGNLADRSIPDSTPGLPAKFGFVVRGDDPIQYGLKNFGPGNATSVTLEAQDETYDVLEGHFTQSNRLPEA